MFSARMLAHTSQPPNIYRFQVASLSSEMPLWGKSQKNPVDVVKAIREGLVALERGDKKSEKVRHLRVISAGRVTLYMK